MVGALVLAPLSFKTPLNQRVPPAAMLVPLKLAAIVVLARAAFQAASTFAGVNGSWRSRTPMAEKTALPMAAAIVSDAGSPAPHAGWVGWSSSTTWTLGTSVKWRIG